MKYIVFGGNGFVGRYLCNSLVSDSKEVVCVDIQDSLDSRIDGKVSYLKVDIRDKSDVMDIDIQPEDLVINMAATQYHTKVPKNRKEYFFNTNFVGTKNLLEVMEVKNCRQYLMFTTDMTYGKPQYLPIDINHPQKPFGPYGMSKKACEDLCREYRKKGFTITIFLV